MYFKSKKDRWMAIILWVIVLSGVLIPLFRGQVVNALIIMLLCGLLLWFWFRTGYKIDKDRLIVYYGPIRQTIYIENIELILLAKMPIIAPALSLDRIQIRSGKYDLIAISPKDKFTFVEELAKLNPDISVDKRLLKEEKGE
ncbi:PH domain-containing protein [Oceanobacillus jeddahense]|uniref:PH domain-containing protein n=1 Tax=Oceanobacillus jeddahense TaxID=1462527 RepID=A0ABY5JLT0_9BACI|nr:PH domain-containing protein [Oceanobacillus jeddahense]UUI01258.1 PH domain-containing protein [Oceanobacillus jeddahense]